MFIEKRLLGISHEADANPIPAVTLFYVDSYWGRSGLLAGGIMPHILR
jgi:hypothetical protein